MAIATLPEPDLDNIKLRLALEGCEYKHMMAVPTQDKWIWLKHPQFGVTYFTGWESVIRHCNEEWHHTYWPKL